MGLVVSRRGRIVLVTGGRKYADWRNIFSTLDAVHAEQPIDLLIHGAAKGADLLCESWAKLRQVGYRGLPAPWKLKGPSAGPMRNEDMLRLALAYRRRGRDIVLVPFPGNVGTAHMRSICAAAGVQIYGG